MKFTQTYIYIYHIVYTDHILYHYHFPQIIYRKIIVTTFGRYNLPRLLYCPPKGKNALKETSESSAVDVCGLPQWDPGINANDQRLSAPMPPSRCGKPWPSSKNVYFRNTMCMCIYIYYIILYIYYVSEIPWFHVTSDSKMRKARE